MDLSPTFWYISLHFVSQNTGILHILIFAWCYCAIICKTLHWQQIWLGSRESNPWLQSHCTDFDLLSYRLCRWALDNKTRLEFTWTMFNLWPAFIAYWNCFEFSLGHVYYTTLCMLRYDVINDEIIHRIYRSINLCTIHGKNRKMEITCAYIKVATIRKLYKYEGLDKTFRLNLFCQLEFRWFSRRRSGFIDFIA